MRFGLLYSLQSRPDQPASQARIYREMLEQVEAGEGLGFDSAWLVEHHFLADGICPSPLVTAAAMAARTRRMTIGTSMYLLPLHRPVQSAEDVAVLDNISNGRIILGVGRRATGPRSSPGTRRSARAASGGWKSSSRL
jgi:alkanesulfonate monooxygenase SsuD/methylene tetrahydromethanopterin reductase-like flavin-dependent oxidoreductase (luciferase family)